MMKALGLLQFVVGLCFALMVDSKDSLVSELIDNAEQQFKLDMKRFKSIKVELSDITSCPDLVMLRFVHDEVDKLQENVELVWRKIIRLGHYPGSLIHVRTEFNRVLEGVETIKNMTKEACFSDAGKESNSGDSNEDPMELVSKLEGFISKRLELLGGPTSDFVLDDDNDFEPGHKFSNAHRADLWHTELVPSRAKHFVLSCKFQYNDISELIESERLALSEDKKEFKIFTKGFSLNLFKYTLSRGAHIAKTWSKESERHCQKTWKGCISGRVLIDVRKYCICWTMEQLNKLHLVELFHHYSDYKNTVAKENQYWFYTYLFERARAVELGVAWNNYKHYPDNTVTKQFAKYRERFHPEWVQQEVLDKYEAII